MKKYLILAMFLILAVALISPVSASAATKAGVKSGSFFYFFDKAFEKADLFFTFNPEKKAKKALEYADERLAEAEESASENKPEAVTEAMKNYQEDISLAETEAKAIKDEAKTKTLLSTIASSTSKHQEILTEVLNKVPEEAKEAIEKAIEASKKGREESMKEVSEIKKDIEETENEVKKEENEEKAEISDDKDNKKEETNKKDEQKKEIEKLKKDVEEIKKTKEFLNKNHQIDDQTTEIEKLKTEIGELKRVKINQTISNDAQQVGYGDIESNNYANILIQIMPRMVRLKCMGPNGQAWGSGTTQLIDNKNPVVITNFHVVALGAPYEVYCFVYVTQPPHYSSFKGKTLLARVGKFDTHYQDEGLDSIDVAVLHIEEASPDEMKTYFSKFPQSFCSNEQIKIGDKVTILGYPAFGGESLTVTEGIISGTLQTKWGPVYKTSAKFDGGVSGGLAIENGNKCVIGIPTWKTKGFTEGVYGQLDITEGLGLIQPWETIKNSGDIF